MKMQRLEDVKTRTDSNSSTATMKGYCHDLLVHGNHSALASFLVICICATLNLLTLTSCGPDDNHFGIDGRFLNMNQGELLVYSPDGAMRDVDTIFVEGGRFDYEAQCLDWGTVIVVMPNGIQIPVFMQPGNSYTINGDVQNLREVTVKGGDDNKLMNEFREAIVDIPATQIPTKQVTEFVKENADSPVSPYLVRHYLIECDKPDYKTAATLLDIILKEQDNDAAVTVLRRKVGALKMAAEGCQLPSFSVTDINGNTISSGQMSTGIWIVSSFASWDFDSVNQLRRIKNTKSDKSADWHILGVSLDASKQMCKSSMSYDIDEYTIVCDEQMTETPLAEKLGMPRTSVAIIIKDGKIFERDLSGEALYKFLREKM